jgi:biopolymer transport protein ExbB
MMKTFGALGGGNLASAAGTITGGVAEALIATACGLLIAIMALFPLQLFERPHRAGEARCS